MHACDVSHADLYDKAMHALDIVAVMQVEGHSLPARDKMAPCTLVRLEHLALTQHAILIIVWHGVDHLVITVALPLVRVLVVPVVLRVDANADPALDHELRDRTQLAGRKL